jgi:serine/threonine protein kinase
MQGSIYWMAPEVARGKGYSAKVDIWSLVCLTLEMLTGHIPWHKVRGNIIYLLGTGNTPPVAEWLSDLAKSFLEQGFILDPEKRPTATMLLDHEFSMIDPLTVDFYTWSQDAIQHRLEEGTTSEEKSSSEDEPEEPEEEGDEFDNFDEEEEEEFEEEEEDKK